MELTVDLPGTQNTDKLKAAIPLAIKVAAQPQDKKRTDPAQADGGEGQVKSRGGINKNLDDPQLSLQLPNAYHDSP
jgi:hypothetical protein